MGRAPMDSEQLAKTLAKTLFMLLLALGLQACSSVSERPGKPLRPVVLDERDYPPPRDIDPATIAEPIPKVEPRARYGNHSPYTVMGKRYWVLPDHANYKSKGIASWYGTKFHGRPTSTLEPYDMYSYTAAHKTLPLPTYVRVTNLDNERSVVVRVNDRGPFVGDRVIDLSYVAAVKLGMHMQGTARVSVEALHPELDAAAQAAAAGAPSTSPNRRELARPEPARPESARSEPATSGQWFLQIGAFSAQDNARMLAARMQHAGFSGVQVVEEAGAAPFRVVLGPFESAIDAATRVPRMEHAGFPRARVVQR